MLGFTNGFRFAPPLPAGPITVSDLWNMLPLDTRMKSGTITGRQLRDYLEDEFELVFSKDPWKLSGGWGPRASEAMKVKLTAMNPPGERLVSLQVKGTDVKDDAKLTIGGCERDGEPLDMICRLKGAADPGHRAAHRARSVARLFEEALDDRGRTHRPRHCDRSPGHRVQPGRHSDRQQQRRPARHPQRLIEQLNPDHFMYLKRYFVEGLAHASYLFGAMAKPRSSIPSATWTTTSPTLNARACASSRSSTAIPTPTLPRASANSRSGPARRP